MKAREIADKYAPTIIDAKSWEDALHEIVEILFEDMETISMSRGKKKGFFAVSAVLEIADKSEAVARELNKRLPGPVYLKTDWFAGRDFIKELRAKKAMENISSRVRANFTGNHLYTESALSTIMSEAAKRGVT